MHALGLHEHDGCRKVNRGQEVIKADHTYIVVWLNINVIHRHNVSIIGFCGSIIEFLSRNISIA